MILGLSSFFSFFIVLGLIHPNITITLSKIGINPTRSKLLDVLIAMGADITVSNQTMEIEPYADITVRSSSLTNITVDESLIPIIIDEIPILAVAGMFASGTMTISGAQELRYKESDRIKQIVHLVQAFQGHIQEHDDGFILTGGLAPTTPIIETAFDHRIAMAFCIMGTKIGPLIIESSNSINTSFPTFKNELNRLGGKIS